MNEWANGWTDDGRNLFKMSNLYVIRNILFIKITRIKNYHLDFGKDFINKKRYFKYN